MQSPNTADDSGKASQGTDALPHELGQPQESRMEHAGLRLSYRGTAAHGLDGPHYGAHGRLSSPAQSRYHVSRTKSS